MATAATGLGTREAFITRTFGHLLGAVLAFVLLELVYFSTGIARAIGLALLSVNWLLVLGAFVVVGWLARGLTTQTRSRGVQYGGLAGYVVAESIIFVPLLFVADYYAQGTIKSAALLTVVAFAGLTLVGFQSRKDFSFLRELLKWGASWRSPRSLERSSSGWDWGPGSLWP